VQIKIFGSGCKKCQKTEKHAKEVLEELDIEEVEVVHVKDPKDIIEQGVVNTPGLMIDGKLLSAGKVPSKKEISAWVEKMR